MTIDEAIEALKIAKHGWPMNDTERFYKALELGIEALKREKFNRENPKYVIVGTLPGETEK